MALAVIIALIAMIGSCGYGIYLMTEDETVIGALTMVLGPIAAWISGFFLYGFGRLIDNSDYIAYKMGRRDGYGIPDTSGKLEWTNPEEDDVEEPVPAPQFVAQRVVTEVKDEAPKSFCTSCGNKMSGDSVFCPKCGSKIQ